MLRDRPPLPAPCDLGAPERFTRWRNGQGKAFESLLRNKRRFQILALPTGVGKSLVNVTYPIFSGLRGLYLTSTRGLQDQIRRDYEEETDITDVRGMGNYPCKALTPINGRAQLCDEGPCLDGEECEFKDKGCHYFDALRAAQLSQFPSTNYAMWFSLARRRRGLGHIDVLICDEAHEIPDELGRFLRVELDQRDVYFPQGVEAWPKDKWASWAIVQKAAVANRIPAVPRWERKKLRRLVEDLGKLAEVLRGRGRHQWVIEKVVNAHGLKWTFEPIWPAKFMRDWLWGDIATVILSSATIKQKTLEMMGLTPDDYHFLEVASPIPVAKRPVIHVPTVRMSWRVNDGDLAVWVARMDRIIEGRLDRKGIIHTVSYKRAQDILRRSEYRDIMILHDSRNAREVIRQFQQGDAPQVLVSPSVHTGWDFPYDQAQYQIIAKIPFPDTRSRMMEARTAEDKSYPMYLAMMSMIQAAGRINRAVDDAGETFIVDDNVRWFIGRYRRFAPHWFLQAYRSVLTIPTAPRLARAR